MIPLKKIQGNEFRKIKMGKRNMIIIIDRYYFFALDESRCSVLSAASEILVKKSTCIWVGVN